MSVSMVAVILGLCLPATGCKKAGSSRDAQTMEPPASDAEAESDDPLAELAALEDRMRALGLPVAVVGGSTPDGLSEEVGADADAGASADRAKRDQSGGKDGEALEQQDDEGTPPAPSSASEAPRDWAPGVADDQRCANLCDLSEAICQLEVKICGLSEVHEGDSTYANACTRAIDDCDVAGDACDHCAS